MSFQQGQGSHAVSASLTSLATPQVMTWLCPPGQPMSLTTATPALFPPLAWRDWPFGAEPLSSASGELIRCHVLTAGCSVGPGPAGSLEEQNISYNWTVYLVLPPTPRPRPPRHSSLVHWDLFNDLFQWGKRSQFCPDTCLKMTNVRHTNHRAHGKKEAGRHPQKLYQRHIEKRQAVTDSTIVHTLHGWEMMWIN